ncbi:MAG: hypothetical protein ABR563_08185 [Pyrinomonadaceae bacterium]
MLLICCFAAKGSELQSQEEKGLPASDLPQAAPVYNLFKSLKTSDFELYRSVWTTETLKMYREKKKDWIRNHRRYLKGFCEDLGDCRLKDLRFFFRKDESLEAGVVFIIYKGERRTGFNVIKEDGKWKIREM